jgi:oxygen-independent coproporphyrinogen-3 oxidase
MIIETLTHAGYLYIGMDHFVKAGDPLALAKAEGKLCRNFQGYAVDKAHELLGLGVSSISHIAGVYAQNAVALNDYYRALENNQLPVSRGLIPTREDLLRQEIIQQLACYRCLDIEALEHHYQISFSEHFRDALDSLRQFEGDALIEWQGSSRLLVTNTGSLLLRNICMAFDEYAGKAAGTRQTFSRAI